MPISTESKPVENLHNRLMSFDEARAFLGIGKGTFYKLLANKKDPVPSIKIGKLYKFQMEKLLWWIEKQSQ